MKKIITPCFLLLLMGCLDGDEIKNEVIEKPRPKGAKKVNIIVDASYHLKDTDAHSLYDSISMDNETTSLFIPEGFESAAFFISENDEVLAVVRTSPSDSDIKVNANTVAQALMTLVPSYHSLSKQQRDKFEREVSDILLYKEFVLLVDKNLKEGKPIYSTDSEFIDNIVNLHVYINETYLGIPDENNNGGIPDERKHEKPSEGDLKFSNWMKRDNGGTVTNRMRSYVYVSFKANSGGQPIPKLLKPNSDIVSQFTLPSLNLKDDCYEVNINQTHYDAKSQNILAGTISFTGLFFDTIFGYMPGQDKNACIAAIAGSLIGDVTTTVMNAANLTAWDYVDKTAEAVWNGFKTGANQKHCLNILTPQKIMLALGQQTAAALQVLKFINYGYKFAEIVAYLYPLYDPIEINETMQLYDGKLKEACVGVEKDGILQKEYALGETIHPSIILKAQSQYAEWEKSGFEVKWELLPGNGKVNMLSNKTSNEGKASVSWILPDDISEATLIANIKDKEGDHLNGSPLKFNVSLKDSLEIYRLAAIGNWTVSNAEYPNDEPYNMIYFSDGTVKYVGKGGTPFSGGQQYPATWTIKKNNGRYYLYESGFWHPGYNQFRRIGTGLPNEYLSYPITFMKTYNNLGGGLREALTYRKK